MGCHIKFGFGYIAAFCKLNHGFVILKWVKYYENSYIDLIKIRLRVYSFMTFYQMVNMNYPNEIMEKKSYQHCSRKFYKKNLLTMGPNNPIVLQYTLQGRALIID